MHQDLNHCCNSMLPIHDFSIPLSLMSGYSAASILFFTWACAAIAPASKTARCRSARPAQYPPACITRQSRRRRHHLRFAIPPYGARKGSLRFYRLRRLVPRHIGFDWLRQGQRRTGRFSGSTIISMLRATPRCRRMNPARSSVSTIWWTEGGLTRK